MGRRTFEKILSFNIEWAYYKPVFVWSSKMKALPNNLKGRVDLITGDITSILTTINAKAYTRLYIDGGSTIQLFLKQDLIDEMIITHISVLLGDGVSLFGTLPRKLEFTLAKSEVHLGRIVQETYIRKR